MSQEATFQISGKAGDVIVLVRGDTYADLLAAATAAGVDSEQVAKFFASAFGGNVPEAKAVAVVTQQLGATPVPQSSVGQPLPQPGVVPAPPTAGYPGDCPHGQRQFKSSNTTRGSWSRWECAIPWSKGLAKGARCEPINV